VNILRAISRCKDECISPAAYLAEAKAALTGAGTDEKRESAERAVEVGEVTARWSRASTAKLPKALPTPRLTGLSAG
jgi:hypothetical protein